MHLKSLTLPLRTRNFAFTFIQCKIFYNFLVTFKSLYLSSNFIHLWSENISIWVNLLKCIKTFGTVIRNNLWSILMNAACAIVWATPACSLLMFPCVVGRVMAPKSVHILSWEHVNRFNLTWQKGLWKALKLKTLRWGDCPGLSRCAHLTAWILKNEKPFLVVITGRFDYKRMVRVVWCEKD